MEISRLFPARAEALCEAADRSISTLGGLRNRCDSVLDKRLEAARRFLESEGLTTDEARQVELSREWFAIADRLREMPDDGRSARRELEEEQQKLKRLIDELEISTRLARARLIGADIGGFYRVIRARQLSAMREMLAAAEEGR